MLSRRIPASLVWLALLFALAVATSAVAIVVTYIETRSTARTTAEAITRGHVDAGRAALTSYGCGGCHQIPGAPGAAGKVGPSLKGIATRADIAGALPNDPEVMVRWLMHPQALRPGNGMPEMGVTERDARDIAAYLYTAR